MVKVIYYMLEKLKIRKQEKKKKKERKAYLYTKGTPLPEEVPEWASLFHHCPR